MPFFVDKKSTAGLVTSQSREIAVEKQGRVTAPILRPTGPWIRAPSAAEKPRPARRCRRLSCVFRLPRGADVEGRRTQSPVERRIVELGIVGQRHQRRARISLYLGQCFIRPAPVDAEPGEALDLGECRARINDQDIVARQICELRQGLCDMYRIDQNQPERRVEYLDEDGAGCRLETFAAVFGQQRAAARDRVGIDAAGIGQRGGSHDPLPPVAKLGQQATGTFAFFASINADKIWDFIRCAQQRPVYDRRN